MFNGKTHYKWPFSIAMLNYQRVCSTTCWSSLVIKWELNKIGVDNPKGRPCGLGSHIDLQMWSCFMRNMFEQKHTKTMCFFHDFELLQTSKVPFSRWCTATFFFSELEVATEGSNPRLVSLGSTMVNESG